MLTVIAAFVLLCSTSSTPVTCNSDFKICVENQYELRSEINQKEKSELVFKSCYESELFQRHLENNKENL